MKFKRLLILICTLVCCLCMGLAVVGCDNGDTPPNPDQNQGQTPGGETPGGETPGGETNPDLEPFEGNPPICIEHQWGEGYVDVVKKTCTTDGKQARTCSVCKRREIRTIKSTGHTYVEQAGKPATCTEGGYEKYQRCSVCGDSTKKDDPPLGHDLQDVEAKAATCTEVGWTAYQKCSRCSYNTLDDEEVTEAHYIPLLEHDYGGSEDPNAECKMCGKTRYIGSKGLEIVAAGTVARVVSIGTCTDTIVTIPEEYDGKPVTEITDHAFSTLKSTDYDKMSDEEKKAFDDRAVLLNKVTEIRMRGIQRILDYSFAGLPSLTKVDLGTSLQRIGAMAFTQCESLKEVTIPASCSYIDGDAFFYCENIKKISVEEGNEFFKSVDDKYLIVKQTGELKFVSGTEEEEEHITFPEEVKSIGYYAFAQHFRLKEITIPGTIEKIGEQAFFMCTALEKVTLEAGVKEVAQLAFRNCASLTTVIINIEEVTKEVEGQEVKGVSLESIAKYAFSACFNLKEITFNGTKAQWQQVSKKGEGILKGEPNKSECLTIKCRDGNMVENTVGDYTEAQ